MGGLGHYLEGAGFATASISLIRLHTEKIRPPRALWVPFELGRPFGVPHDAAFQSRVLQAMLDLFEESEGPVLADYPEDAQAGGTDEMEGLACPMRFDAPGSKDETLETAVLREIQELQPWYDLAIERRQRTTVGVTGLNIEEGCAHAGKLADILAAERSHQWPVASCHAETGRRRFAGLLFRSRRRPAAR